MTVFLTMLLRPVVLIVLYLIPMAVGLALVRRMRPGKLRDLLLTPLGKKSRLSDRRGVRAE